MSAMALQYHALIERGMAPNRAALFAHFFHKSQASIPSYQPIHRIWKNLNDLEHWSATSSAGMLRQDTCHLDEIDRKKLLATINYYEFHFSGYLRNANWGSTLANDSYYEPSLGIDRPSATCEKLRTSFHHALNNHSDAVELFKRGLRKSFDDYKLRDHKKRAKKLAEQEAILFGYPLEVAQYMMAFMYISADDRFKSNDHTLRVQGRVNQFYEMFPPKNVHISSSNSVVKPNKSLDEAQVPPGHIILAAVQWRSDFLDKSDATGQNNNASFKKIYEKYMARLKEFCHNPESRPMLMAICQEAKEAYERSYRLRLITLDELKSEESYWTDKLRRETEEKFAQYADHIRKMYISGTITANAEIITLERYFEQIKRDEAIINQVMSDDIFTKYRLPRPIREFVSSEQPRRALQKSMYLTDDRLHNAKITIKDNAIRQYAMRGLCFASLAQQHVDREHFANPRISDGKRIWQNAFDLAARDEEVTRWLREYMFNDSFNRMKLTGQ
jgi:hypothetical protein